MNMRLHPVLFDGALQVFSAGAATVEDRRARMKLPVRFARILYLRSPGATASGARRCSGLQRRFPGREPRLYDEAGTPCVLVDGFRAMSVASVRRNASFGSARDVMYHVALERSGCAASALRPKSSARCQSCRRRLGELWKKSSTAVALTRLQARVAAADDLAAAHLARGSAGHGVWKGAPLSLRNRCALRRHAARFRETACHPDASRVVRARMEHSGYRPTSAFRPAADSAETVLRNFVQQHPGHLPEALLCSRQLRRTRSDLARRKGRCACALRRDGPELLEQFYSDGLLTSHWLAAIAAAVSEAARALPEGRGLRILEVGAGTGGLASQVLPLLERGLHSYIFSDVSAGFFSAAAQKLAAFPEVTFQLFDLEKPGSAQDLALNSFDFIIGTNVLHAVADLHLALGHLHELLSPGGSLVFVDTASPQLWTESVFGLTSGWWRFTDRELRPEQPLLQRPQWERLLSQTGFEEVGSLPGLIGPAGEGQVALFARKPWMEAGHSGGGDRFAAGEIVARFRGCWRLGRRSSCNDCGRQASVAASRGAGRNLSRLAMIFTLRAGLSEDWTKLFAACGEDPVQRIAYLWTLDAELPGPGNQRMMQTDALLHLAQALEKALPMAKLRLDLVTRGAQPVGREASPCGVAQAPALGFLRVWQNEFPNLTCRASIFRQSARPEMKPCSGTRCYAAAKVNPRRPCVERRGTCRGSIGDAARARDGCQPRCRCALSHRSADISRRSGLCLLPCGSVRPARS